MKNLNNLSLLKTVNCYADFLREQTISTENVTWVENLFGLNKLLTTKKLDFGSIRPYPIKSLNASNTILDADATYIQPYLLNAISDNLNVVPEHLLIENRWDHSVYYELGLENHLERNALIYNGDVEVFKSVVAKMFCEWDHKNTFIPVSFVLPKSQKHWDVFNFSKEETADFLSSTNGKLALLSILQLLDVPDSFLKSILRLSGLTYPRNKEDLATLVHLNDLYGGVEESLNGYCLTSKAKSELKPLMNFDDAQNTNEQTAVIPRIISNNKDTDLKYGVLSALKENKREGKLATEKDLEKIRESASFCVSLTGGTIVTLNLPVTDDTFRLGKCSTPTIIAPKVWLEFIKSNRASNNRQDNLDTIPAKKLNETKRQLSSRIKKTGRILNKRFTREMQDQTIDKSVREFHYSYPAPILNR